MKKLIKYGLIVLTVALVGYNSIYIKKLSDVQKAAPKKFDATAYAKKLWKEELRAKLDSAISISDLKKAIEKNAEETFKKYTNALAIGNYRYALVKGRAVVDSVNQDNILITIQATPSFQALLITEFVYGNTLRDASRLVDLKEFPNTSDLNQVSEALNKIIRETVVPSFKPLLKPGSKIEFAGAIQLNKEHIHFDNLEIVPARVKISP